MIPSPREVHEWSIGIGLPEFFGIAYTLEHGHLPRNIRELNKWGKAKDYRDPLGIWHWPNEWPFKDGE